MSHIIHFPKGTFNFMRCKFNLVLIMSHHYTIIYKDSQHCLNIIPVSPLKSDGLDLWNMYRMKAIVLLKPKGSNFY